MSSKGESGSLEGFQEVHSDVDLLGKSSKTSATDSEQGHFKLKQWMADAKNVRFNKTVVILSMTILVTLTNLLVMGLIFYASLSEVELLKEKIITGSDRIIDGKVYLALIGGTVAEVSAVFIIILKSLFK